MIADTSPQSPAARPPGRHGVLIGRFQPFHQGHAFLLERILETVDSVVLVVGSSYASRSLRNPFTLAEREAMIRAALPAEEAGRVRVVGVADVYYSDTAWVDAVRGAVESALPSGAGVCLYGHNKDASSYYLALFPGWDYAELSNYRNLSATPIREALLASAPAQLPDLLDGPLRDCLPAAVRDWLRDFAAGPDFAEIQAEAAAVQRFQQAWEGSPYPPMFVTVDALVLCGEQVLLIRRGQRPGRGLLAFPGGFLDPEERLEAACRRELAEETGLQLPLALKPLARFVGDHPDRSDRGRFVTHAFAYRLPDADTPPPVAGGDDAASAAWHALSALRREEFFEDHYLILQQLLPACGLGDAVDGA